ncbi:MAG: hypothetical protein KF849_08330 [Rhizobiaceae bacterium]|nr:hypothetical protein [Rhizobiaceae bacterium]
MRILLAATLLTGLGSPVLACDGGRLFGMIDAPLPAQADVSFDVAVVDSTEGGNWDVYLAVGGKLAENLVRTDFGEVGRYQTRLVVSSPDAYAVTATRYIYSAPAYVSGSTTVREEKDIYVFCDGKLYLPEEDFGLGEDYKGQAADALATFDAEEVKAYLPALKR